MLLAAFSPFFITSQSRKRLWYGKSGYAYYASLLHVAARGQRNNTGFCFGVRYGVGCRYSRFTTSFLLQTLER